jgi:hypothetical protein
MTALEYMERQAQSNRINYNRQVLRGAPEEDIQNIKEKIDRYEEASDALRERKKWVSVDERFPDDGAVVLCKTKYIYDVLQWYARLNTWLGKDRAYSSSHVTYWMPIPELPKEGAE